jgi:hypothetical protein
LYLLLLTKTLVSIVFRLDPAASIVQNSGFVRVVWVNFFKKNQNDIVFSKKTKTKVNGLQLGFWQSPGQSIELAKSHRVFSSPVFSSTRSGSSSRSIEFRVDPPDRVLKLCSSPCMWCRCVHGYFRAFKPIQSRVVVLKALMQNILISGVEYKLFFTSSVLCIYG